MGFLSRLLGGGKAAPTPPAQRPFEVVAHVAFEGAIHVMETPLGKDWEHDEDARGPGGRLAPRDEALLLGALHGLAPT